MKLKQLSEQVMVITGASSGIGLVTARMAAKEGVRLVLASRSVEALEDLSNEINNSGGQAVRVIADVGNQEDVREIARIAEQTYGGFDTWVNNAGVSIYGKIEDIPIDDMHQLYDTNFWGLVYGSLEAAKHFKTRTNADGYAGAIIQIGSILSDRAVPLQGIYSSSKHAVKGFTDAFRMELEAENAPVSITLVKPAAINTPYVEHAKNYLEVEPQHTPPVYAPEPVARAILHVAENPQRDITVGGGGKALAAGGDLLPGLTDVYMERNVIPGTKSNKPPRPREDNALDHAGGQLQERGDFPGHTMESSFYTEAAMRPRLTLAALIGAGLAIAAVVSAVQRSSSSSSGASPVRPQIAPPALPDDKPIGKLEQVFAFNGSMPTGVTVSEEGRIFVNYPRWGDPVPFTVAELVDGREVAYPNREINRYDESRLAETFVSVQSVVVDPRNRLWVLDTGAPKLEPIVSQDAPKLVGIDLRTNTIFKTVYFPEDVVLKTTYLNDIRFDLRKGTDGVAYITDSSDKGANGIIVVDLATGTSRRYLHDHPTTKALPNYLPFVEGQPMLQRKPGKPAQNIKIGADGIAISADGSRLFYCPLASRKLYSVSTDALLNANTNAEIEATIRDEGMKPASDGLESDADGRVYATAYESNAIVRRDANGGYETIAHDPRMLWPDTMSLAADGYLYFMSNQLHRQSDYHNGRDLREKPYSLFRVRVNAKPVRLR